MKIFITGATGMLGGHTAMILKRAGYDVTASGRNMKKLTEFERCGMRICPLDYASTGGLSDIVSGHDVIIHSGALSSAWGKKQHFKKQNADATSLLVNAAIKANIKKFIYISSSSVYFDFNDRLNIIEQDKLPQQFASSYTWSKRLAEQAILAAKEKIEAVVLRPRGIIGAGDTALIPRLLRAAGKGILPLPNNGEAMTSMTCVEDVVGAIKAVINCQHDLSGKIYNVAGPEDLSVRSLISEVLRATKTKARLKPIPYSVISPIIGFNESIHQLFNLREPAITKYSFGLLSFSQTLSTKALTHDTGWKPMKHPFESIEDFAASMEGKNVL